MPDWLAELFARYGYALIVGGVLADNLAVPAPGPSVVMAGAWLAQSGRLSLAGVFAMACAAAFVGDSIGYAIGRTAGGGLLERHRRLFRLTAPRQHALAEFFDHHGIKTVIAARFVPGVHTLAGIAAGASRMGWWSFTLGNAVGALAWTATYCAIGYLVGESWSAAERWAGWVGVAALGAVLIATAIAIAHHHRARNRRAV